MNIFARDRTQFKSIKNLDFLNESINHHMETLKQNTDKVKIMELLQRMSEHSVKTLGVSFMSNKTMAKLINVHTRTVQRYTATMEQLGIISKVKTLRDRDRGQTSNTYVILPVLKWNCRRGCRTNKPSLKPFLKQDDINIVSNDKLLKLFEWKLKDKAVQYGSTYVQKTVETLFNYAESLMQSEERQQKLEEILERHGCTNADITYVPSPNDWLEQKDNPDHSVPSYLSWLQV